MILILNMLDNLIYEARYLERDGHSDLGGYVRLEISTTTR